MITVVRAPKCRPQGLLLGIVLGPFFLTGCGGPRPPEKPPSSVAPEPESAKVEASVPDATEIALRALIKTTVDADMFPAVWKEHGLPATATPVRSDLDGELRQALLRAMRLYPVGLLQDNLDAVYLVDELTIRGTRCSGTNSRRQVFVATALDAGSRFRDYWVGVTFHHEFATVLLRDYPTYFDADDWSRQNPAGFQYIGSGLKAMEQDQGGLSYARANLVDGFIFGYSKASIDNDFSCIAQELFSGSSVLWQAYDKYPRVREKIRSAVAFYGRLDQRFSEEFFRSIISKLPPTSR
jgi:hypothetical protein